MAVAAQWEGTQPTTRGLASAVTSPSSLRADQAPPVIGEIGRNSKVPPEDVHNLQLSGISGQFDYAALAALDALYHPIDLVALAPAPMAGVAYAAQASESLTEADMRAILTATGWPVELHDQALTIAWCESKYSPGAVGDGGNSLGLWQIWYGWFAPAGYSVEQAYDPVTNSRVALYVRTTRGRWGGGGGWSCAGLNGIE